MYFSCRPEPDADGNYVSYSAWLDLDRHDLRNVVSISNEPVLSLGSRGEFDEFGTYPFSAVEYRSQILGFYGGWTRCESVPFNVAIGKAISEDGGATFRKAGPGPTLSYTADEPFILSGPKIRVINNMLFLYYIAGRRWIVHEGRPEPVYKIRLATSEDGVQWTKLNRDLIPSFLEEDEAQASPDVTFSGGKYHMFFCYRRGRNYRNSQNGYRIGYAWSDDAVNWHRDDRKAGLSTSVSGWDAEMVCYPHILVLDGKTYMFYIGNGVGREGFGLAELDGCL